MSNKLIIAAAGSGKTTFLVKQALSIHDGRVLITTFTEANEQEINKKFIEINGCVPPHVTVQTWFSFLLQHGVKPYQSVICDHHITGLKLVNTKSGFKSYWKGRPIYFGETDIPQYYLTKSMQIYSDKISKFVWKANELTHGLVINRLSRIYPHIFIDEVQDLAGYDLELIKILLSSKSKVLMVGDPRQVTYHTHDEAKHNKYSEGKIEEFIRNECKGCSVEIDKETLNVSFRNKKDICNLANQVFSQHSPCGYQDHPSTDHDGVFFISPDNVDSYLEKYHPVQLRDKITVPVNPNYSAYNFGDSKGLTFERVLIYPTKPMLKWFIDHQSDLQFKSRCRLYVAITRARHSVGIVFDNKKKIVVDGIQTYSVEQSSPSN